MLNNDLISSHSKEEYKYPFTNVVILQKESTGISRACRVSDINTIESQAFSVKSATKQVSSSVLVIGKSNHQKNPIMISFTSIPEYCLAGQDDEEPSIPVLMTSVSSPKRPNKKLWIFIIAGAVLLITRRRSLIGLARGLGGQFISAITVSKK